jgi:hypothetical protein
MGLAPNSVFIINTISACLSLACLLYTGDLKRKKVKGYYKLRWETHKWKSNTVKGQVNLNA